MFRKQMRHKKFHMSAQSTPYGAIFPKNRRLRETSNSVFKFEFHSPKFLQQLRATRLIQNRMFQKHVGNDQYSIPQFWAIFTAFPSYEERQYEGCALPRVQ